MAAPTTVKKRAALDAAFAKRKARANALAEATVRNLPDLAKQGPGAVADALKDAYGLGERYLRSRTPGGVVADVAGGARALRDATTRYATDRAQNPMKVLADAYGVGKDIVTAVPQAVEDVAKLSERAQALKASDPEAARRLQASIAMAALGAVPGVRKGKQAVKAAEKLAAKYDVEAPAMVKRYGPKQVPEAVDMLAKKLRERGANPKIGKPYTTPHGTSVYLYPSETIDAYTPQLRISDHSGGWGANRGPVKPGGFDLSTEMSEAELNAAVDAAISSPSGRAFWDADNLKAETTAAYQAAVDQAKAAAPDRALAAYTQLVGKGSANSIKRATSQARTYDINFMPPKPPAKPKPAQQAAEKVAAKYLDPESTRIADWQWRPQEDVKAELGLTEVPPHVVDYGRFMDEQAVRAAKGQMTPRDLLKAYGITRSSMQRTARSLKTAQKYGLELEQLGLKEVRPEGAFSELLGTPEGQAYLDAAQRGQVDDRAIADMMAKFRPYGFQNALGRDLEWGARNLPQRSSEVADMVAAAREGASAPEDWTRFVKDKVTGVDAAKAGFVGAMLGRGDLPTFDARQIILQTGQPTKKATKYLSRKKGEGSVEAVRRLTARMEDLNLALPPELEPYRQHLTHHTVWDKASNEMTTHEDVRNALKNYAGGGLVEKYGV